MSNEKKNNEEFVFETPFDVLELPSKGFLYPGKPSTVKVEYLTAADENILTSPNLIRSGKVLDVLIERKIKSKEIPMSSLLVGDRNAIMIWLRATGYGEMYSVKMTDPTTFEEFETEIDLSKLKTKELTVQPDENNEFSFELPRSKKKIKFKLLTVADESSIAKKSEQRNKVTKSQISNALSYRLQSQIREIDGNRDPNYIAKFIEVMPAYDSLKFREYSDYIEPGIDLEVEVEGPSGPFRSIFTIGPNFFLPNARV
ncbi:MAG: hypothetical protein KAJ19_17255 [Gammaproteobacteria bacterium]|nr:hypothetical protein [Gammaproteobacteria bacterium]